MIAKRFAARLKPRQTETRCCITDSNVKRSDDNISLFLGPINLQIEQTSPVTIIESDFNELAFDYEIFFVCCRRNETFFLKSKKKATKFVRNIERKQLSIQTNGD